jgi:hypothetical protein
MRPFDVRIVVREHDPDLPTPVVSLGGRSSVHTRDG